MIRCYEVDRTGNQAKLIEVSSQPSRTVWHLPGEGEQILPSIDDALSHIFSQDSQVREHLGMSQAFATLQCIFCDAPKGQFDLSRLPAVGLQTSAK